MASRYDPYLGQYVSWRGKQPRLKKKWIEAGTFALTEPIASIPMGKSFLNRWGAQME